MTTPTTHLAEAIERMARAEDATDSSATMTSSTTTAATIVRVAAPSKREVDAIYDDLIARLADTLVTLASDDVDTTPRSFRASILRRPYIDRICD